MRHKVWERWDRVSEMDDPAGYLHRTAINVFRDRSRRLVLATRRAVRISRRPDEYDALEARSVAASVLGESMRLGTMLGGAIILLGIWLVNRVRA